MKKTMLLLSACVIVVVCGCSRRVGDCTLMSTKNIYCQNVDLTKLEQHRGIIGKDIRFWGIGSNIKDAADKALEQADGNLLIDPVVYYESFPLVCGGFVVKGTVVKVPYQSNKDAQASGKGKITGYRASRKPGSDKDTITPVYESDNVNSTK